MAWENNFDARELDAGYKIYEAGNVIHIKMADHLIEADVLDGDVDHVMIKHMGNNITAMDCECERGREGHACAHEAALLFAVEDRLEDEMRVDPHEVEDLLNFVNEQEMKDVRRRRSGTPAPPPFYGNAGMREENSALVIGY